MTKDEMNQLVFSEARRQQFDYGVPKGEPRVVAVMAEFIDKAQGALKRDDLEDFEAWIRCAEYTAECWKR